MQTETIPLWPAGQVPGALGDLPEDVPDITLYPPAPDKNTGAAIVICPGGGYVVHAPHEAEPVARWLNTLGVTGIILKYRLGQRYQHPTMLQDAQRAIRLVRAGAERFAIDGARIGVLGFSAGGHLASTLSTHFDAGDPHSDDAIERMGCRPDLAILIYPVITLADPHTHEWSRKVLLGDVPDPALVEWLSSERQVTPQTPPTFLVHSYDDDGVPIENTLHYALALRTNNVPFAMQIYAHGGHGYGMGNNDPVLRAWPEQCAAWMRQRGFLNGR